MKLKKPSKAEDLWTAGCAKTAPIFPGIFSRNEIRVKLIRKMTEKAKAMEMKAGTAIDGAESSSPGALFGRTERSMMHRMRWTSGKT